ncbi:elongin BC and Polycomb repressive complex 2-associated protein [Lissotriton helveticus]
MLASGEYQGLRQRERLRKPPCDMYLARMPPGEFQAGFQEVEGISLGYLQVDGRRMFSLAQVLSDLFKDIPRTTISKRMESLRIKSRRCDLRELRTLKAMQSLPSRAVQGSLISREDLAVLCQEARRRRRAEPSPQLPLPLPGSKQGTSAGYSSDSESSLEASSSGSDTSGDSSSAEEDEGAGSSDSDSGDSVQSTRYRQAALPEPDPSLLRLSQHLWARTLHGQSWGVSGRGRGQAEGEQGPSGVDRRQGKPRSAHQRSGLLNQRDASRHSRSAPADPRITSGPSRSAPPDPRADDVRQRSEPGHSRHAPVDLRAATGHSRPAAVDPKASTGHSRQAPVDSKAAAGHSRPTLGDPRAPNGHFRPGTVEHTGTTGHARPGPADPKAATGHSWPSSVDPRAAAGNICPVPQDPRAALAKEKSAAGCGRSSHGNPGYATEDQGSADAAIGESTATSRAESSTVGSNIQCPRPALGDLRTTHGCQGEQGATEAYKEDLRTGTDHRGGMGVAAGYPRSVQAAAGLEGVMRPVVGYQGDGRSTAGYLGDLDSEAGYQGLVHSDLGPAAANRGDVESISGCQGLVHSDLGPAAGYRGDVESISGSGYRGDVELASGYQELVHRGLLLTGRCQKSIQSDLGSPTGCQGDLEPSARYQGSVQSFVGSEIGDLGFSLGDFVGNENRSGSELEITFSEGDLEATELDLRIGKRGGVSSRREQDSPNGDQGLRAVEPLPCSSSAEGQLGSVELRLGGEDVRAAERPNGPADLRSPACRHPGAAGRCLELADIDLGAADGNQGILEVMLESARGGHKSAEGFEADRCIFPLLPGHELLEYKSPEVTSSTAPPHQQRQPPSPLEDWGTTPSTDNKELLRGETTEDVPACEGALELPCSPPRDSPEPRRENFDRLIRQSKLWCYAKGFSADGKEFRLSFGRAPASKRARSGGSTPSKKAFKGSGSERNAKRRRLPKGAEPARQQSRRRQQARPGRKRKSSSAAPTPARRPFTLLEHFPCTPSLVLGADGDLSPAYSLGAGRSRSVPKLHPVWKWQLGGTAIPLPPSLKFRSFPPVGNW